MALPGLKAAGGAAAGAALLSAIVVMLMTPPRSTREWAVGMALRRARRLTRGPGNTAADARPWQCVTVERAWRW